MPLNRSSGNMYHFITHTWNAIKGQCPHDCSYCFMKRFGEQKPLRLDRKELRTDLGKDNFIFVGSSCDMWANDVPKPWILSTLVHCRNYDNTYLFQSKNPQRMRDFRSFIPAFSVLGTTIETNRVYPEMGLSPRPRQRAEAIGRLAAHFRTMVTIEPIMDFSVEHLSELIFMCEPAWVNIGADSKGHGLPEPSGDKIRELIDNLRRNDVQVKVKSNLKLLLSSIWPIMK